MAIHLMEYLQILVCYLSKLLTEIEWVEFKGNSRELQMIEDCIPTFSNSATLCERHKAYLI